MSDRGFGITALLGLAAAAGFLILGAAIDSSAVSVIGALTVLIVFAAKEIWQWRGQGRLWLTMMGAFAGVIVVAFVWQKLFG